MKNLDPSTAAVYLLIAVVLIDRILGILKTRGIDLHLMARQLDDLHAWHSVKDDEGVRIWYVRKSLETAIGKLSENIGKELIILHKIEGRLQRLEEQTKAP